MEFANTLHTMTQMWVCDNPADPERTSHTPTADELKAAFAYAVKYDVIVRLLWIPLYGYSYCASRYVHAKTDLDKLINDVHSTNYAV